MSSPAPPFDKAGCTYTSCYCEENVWHLCDRFEKLRTAPATAAATAAGDSGNAAEAAAPPSAPQQRSHEEQEGFAVFISNPAEQTYLWRQQKGDPVCWDYHVIFVWRDTASGRRLVYDLDTTLPFPCDFDTYVNNTCRPLRSGMGVDRFFRVVPAPLMLAHFASDRSHMRDANGRWMAPPPSYPCLGQGNNLASYRNMTSHTQSDTFGRVLSEAEFRAHFADPQRA